jgi:molecular chaperone DnaK
LAVYNKSLGRFILDGIPPAPRGIPQVEVTFDIDANGILNVTAKDKATSKAQSIKITGSTGLNKDEIEKMKKDAEMHADEDKKKKEEIEVKNNADNLIYQAEKSLKEASDKVSAEVKTEVEEKLKTLKDLISAGSIEEIKKASEELSASLSKIGQAMYQQQEPKPDESDGKTEEASDVQEGEVVKE